MNRLIFLLVLTVVIVVASAKTMVFAPAFSLANPGSVTLFDITQPSKYVKEFKTEMVMYYDSLALNRKDMEVYMLGVGGPDIWLDIWNPETLEL